tara:strand:+ start:4039 stop:6108 length:2070 start_codon:yes stop_codon:yes gene_type:complete
MNQTIFFLGEWEVIPQLNRILHAKNRTPKQLEPQLMKLLLYLVAHQKELVKKEKLIETVWSDVVVSENVLTRAISSLRKELGDNRQNPRYIETISKTGYRLIAKVKYNSKETPSGSIVNLRIKKKPLLVISLFTFILLSSSFPIWRLLSPPVVKVLNPVVVANNNIPEYYPAISRDGQFVAFASKSVENNNWGIYVKRLGTEPLISLSDSPATELRPVWSNDGSNVYFIRYEPAGPTIYKTPMTGGKETRILTAARYSSGNFDVSPKGDQIIFNNRLEKNKPLKIELTNLDLGEKKLITNPPKGFNGDIHPTYSPDGTKIGFIREKNSVSMYLYVIDLASNTLTQITKDHVSINGFDWSSDGKSLVYSTDRTGIYKLWKVNLKDLNSTLLPISDYQMVMPRIADNNKTIYAKLQDNVNIWSYSLTSKEGKIWRATNQLDLNPSSSYNGSKIAFTTNRSGSFKLWTSNKDGSDPIAVTTFKGQYINTPRWSHDDTEIVFQGYYNGQSNIYKINSLGGIPENVTKNISGENHTPIFSADSRFIYYSSNTSGNWEIWKMSVDGGSQIQITTNGGYAPQQLKENGTKLFYVKKEHAGIWSIDLKTKIETLEIQQFIPKKYGAFALSDSGIYYLNSNTRTLDYLDFSSNKTTSLFRPKRISPFGISLSYSSKNNTLLYAQVDHIDADIMLLKEE